MSKVFLVPGLGADYRVFKNIDLQGNDAVNISWVEPDKRDILSSYAQKLIDKYHIGPGSIVIGNSLGGMLAIEIAKKVRLNQVILISSIKSCAEMPASFKWFRFVSIYRVLPAKLFTSLGIFVKYAFGEMTETDHHIFIDMLENTPPVFAKWAVGAILHWDNHVVPENVYHIHGDKDKVFPYKKLKDATIVKDGTHIMIFNRAKEINNWLKNISPL